MQDYVMLTIYVLFIAACIVLGVYLAVLKMFGHPWK